ncbi:hypothetical protein PTKU64_44740 [Paraburkholderia terrae]|uniref:Uncharacterized protein n=1 Tax=Paraburkholderia terrae TaxID=311230 RepID=A0ABM7TQF6_9BURK|nr:hypothetical protein PTKU64_44740 [Paraburkholderia terrae]BDC40733.1 hypothetical protein PTKU15_40300 [Paraburkholderia terrae]
MRADIPAGLQIRDHTTVHACHASKRLLRQTSKFPSLPDLLANSGGRMGWDERVHVRFIVHFLHLHNDPKQSVYVTATNLEDRDRVNSIS